jgi:glycosyltransferase involved in cell wall biosynthesis
MVLPVHDQEARVAATVREWLAMFQRLGVDATIVVIDDGSHDDTWDRLQEFADHPRVRLIRKRHTGHGPTVLRGYRDVAAWADWVFQAETDAERSADIFPDIWEARDGADAVFGERLDRNQDVAYRLLTWASRATVRVLFGARVHDVNMPYRLMRGDSLRGILPHIPDNAVTPNLLIAGAYSLGPWALVEVEVPRQARTGRAVSRLSPSLLAAAVRSFAQTLRFGATLDADELRDVPLARRSAEG